MPEGEIQFELGDLEQEFGFEDPAAEPENFTQTQEERSPSEPSSRNSGTSTVPKRSEAPEEVTVPESGQPKQAKGPEASGGKEKPSVRAELDKIIKL